jgi:hypothetical protein
MDEALNKVIAAIPQQPQRQYATDDQLRVLQAAANKLGLYDAADVIRNLLEVPPAFPVGRLQGKW